MVHATRQRELLRDVATYRAQLLARIALGDADGAPFRFVSFRYLVVVDHYSMAREWDTLGRALQSECAKGASLALVAHARDIVAALQSHSSNRGTFQIFSSHECRRRFDY